MKKIIYIFILIIFFSLNAFAKHSDNFFTYLSKIIYEDCRSYDIIISDQNPGIKYLDTWELVKKIKQPVDIVSIEYLLRWLDKYNQWDDKLNNWSLIVKAPNGKSWSGILSCWSGYLDIWWNDYFWNWQQVEPIQNFQIKDNAKATFWSNSPILETNGDNNKIWISNNWNINKSENNLLINLTFKKWLIWGFILWIITWLLIKKRFFKKIFIKNLMYKVKNILTF